MQEGEGVGVVGLDFAFRTRISLTFCYVSVLGLPVDPVVNYPLPWPLALQMQVTHDPFIPGDPTSLAILVIISDNGRFVYTCCPVRFQLSPTRGSGVNEDAARACDLMVLGIVTNNHNIVSQGPVLVAAFNHGL